MSPENAEKESAPETPKVPEGLSAVVLPELGNRSHFGDLEPVSESETLDRLNKYLADLNEQGADIISIFDVDIDKGEQPGVVGNVSETRKFAIIRKSSK